MSFYACPVCNGYGTVSRPPNIAGDLTTWVSNTLEIYKDFDRLIEIWGSE